MLFQGRMNAPPDRPMSKWQLPVFVPWQFIGPELASLHLIFPGGRPCWCLIACVTLLGRAKMWHSTNQSAVGFVLTHVLADETSAKKGLKLVSFGLWGPSRLVCCQRRAGWVRHVVPRHCHLSSSLAPRFHSRPTSSRATEHSSDRVAGLCFIRSATDSQLILCRLLFSSVTLGLPR
jgi:hypothetical protein